VCQLNEKRVYLLWHVYERAGEEEAKLLGVYSTEQKAKDRVQRAERLPGFAEHRNGFQISVNVLDRDEWPEGFVTVPDQPEAE
jgi:hypothetical protein